MKPINSFVEGALSATGKMPSGFAIDNCLYLKKKLFLIYEPLMQAAWCHWCLVNNKKKAYIAPKLHFCLLVEWQILFLVFLILLEHIKGDQDQLKQPLEKSVRGWGHDDTLLNTYTTPWCTVKFSPCVWPILSWGTQGCAGDQIQIVTSTFGRGHWLDVNPRIHVYNYEYEEKFMTATNKHIKPPHGLLMFWCICFQCYCKMINDFIFGGLDHEKEILSVWLRSLKSEGVGGSL